MTFPSTTSLISLVRLNALATTSKSGFPVKSLLFTKSFLTSLNKNLSSVASKGSSSSPANLLRASDIFCSISRTSLPTLTKFSIAFSLLKLSTPSSLSSSFISFLTSIISLSCSVAISLIISSFLSSVVTNTLATSASTSSVSSFTSLKTSKFCSDKSSFTTSSTFAFKSLTISFRTSNLTSCSRVSGILSTFAI